MPSTSPNHPPKAPSKAAFKVALSSLPLSPPPSVVSQGEAMGGAPVAKKWSIPPRPKPGRKPAAEAPPTKRKAQNRAAQRAFRERRAARVGELEEEKRELEKKHRDEVEVLKEELRRHDRKHKQDEGQWQHQLANQQQLWDQDVQALQHELNQVRSSVHRNSIDQMSPLTRNLPQLPTLNLPLPKTPVVDNSASLQDCSTCGKDGRCECLETVMNGASEASIDVNATPSVKQEPNDEMEIDLTNFGKQIHNDCSNPILVEGDGDASISTPINGNDTCGFCTDETNCICRAEQQEQERPSLEQLPSNSGSAQLPPLVTPPESTTGDEAARRFSQTVRPPQPIEPTSFARGPGTCPSCISDPERRKFCQTLAGLRPPTCLDRSDSSTSADGSRPSITTSSSIDTPRVSIAWSDLDRISSDVTSNGRVTCADAYTLLSKDPNFPELRDRVSFYQELTTEPPTKGKECRSCNTTDCSPYEVDCAGILTAMKERPMDWQKSGPNDGPITIGSPSVAERHNQEAGRKADKEGSGRATRPKR